MVDLTVKQENDPQLQLKQRRIYALWEGIQNLALNYIATEGEKGRLEDAVNLMIGDLERCYESIPNSQPGGGCYPDWFDCNGICSARPCSVIDSMVSGGGLAARLLWVNFVLEGILNAALNFVAYEEIAYERLAKANTIIVHLEGCYEEMERSRVDLVFYTTWFDCDGVRQKRPC